MPGRYFMLAALLIGLGAAYLYWPAPEVAAAPKSQSAKASRPSTNYRWPPQPAAPPVAKPTAHIDSPLLPLAASVPAAHSLDEARRLGDPRQPPLLRDAEPSEAASAWEIADPDRYAAYEQRQQRRLWQNYVHAAGPALARLDADLARARAEGGIAPAEIAQVEEKRRRIAAMQAELSAKLAQP
jgi:hypothetical protein